MATQPMKSPLNAMTAHTVMDGLPPVVARSLEAVTLTNHYPTGAMLFGEGEPARGMYFVLRAGSSCRYAPAMDGH
jgi:hypothetical protein